MPYLVPPRQRGRRQPSQQGDAGLREHHAERTAGQPQYETFRQQGGRNPATTGSQRPANSKLVLPTLGPDQQQARHVRPRHEEDDGHGSEENPQRPAQVSNHGFREWADVRRQTDRVPYFLRDSGHQWKLLDEERNHPGDIVVGLCERHPGFQSSDAVLAEGTRACRRSVESQWQTSCGSVLRNLKDAGRTPMISHGSPLMTRDLPTTSGDVPNACSQ
jgi:hypothetical protein